MATTRIDFRLGALMFAAALGLAACRPAQAPESAPATTAEDATAISETAPAIAPTVAEPTPDLPPVEASDDDFVGWYLEKDGVGLLKACGQTAPLQVADPTFLRDLKTKLGGKPEPTYVRLRVRLGAGSKLEVTEVRQFGVDEGPVPNCVLIK